MSGEIYAKMVEIMSKVTAIGKDRKNQQQGFSYRGIEDVYNHLQPIMAATGVFMLPELVSEQREERASNKGGTLHYSRLHMRYTFMAADGSSVSCSVLGEGMDSGDKATNKAMSIAHKYALFQAFAIPTAELSDPDEETHYVAPKREPIPAQQTQLLDLARVQAGFHACQSLDEVKAFWSGLGMHAGHSQLTEVTAMKDTAKARLGFVGEGVADEPLTDGQMKALQAHYSGVERNERLSRVSGLIGRSVGSFRELSRAEASRLLDGGR